MTAMRYFTRQPIPWNRLARLEREVARQPAGALVTFRGIVRGDQHGPRRVRAIDYAAYPEMADAQLERLASEARARWTLTHLRMLHRLGLVEAGQISVLILTAAEHRQEAYAASTFLIEQVKHQVPIWKRELYDDGTSRWVEEEGVEHAHV